MDVHEIRLAEQRASKEDLGINDNKSITGKDLPANWPYILNPYEESIAYGVLKDEGDDPAEPPRNSHIERLSYELTNGDKRLRFFATFHQRDMNGSNDPNLQQYEILEKMFKESPPQLVLYEGIIDDVNYPLSRERALKLGEQAWMNYLVQQHNKNLKEGEKPILIESGDYEVNDQSNDIRDHKIVVDAAEKFKRYDRIDLIFGSGHAIRQRQAWEQFFESKTESSITSSRQS